MRIGRINCPEGFLSTPAARILFTVFKRQSSKTLEGGLLEITGTSPLFVDVFTEVPLYEAVFDENGGVELRLVESEQLEWRL
jgi:hypothetical protein